MESILANCIANAKQISLEVPKTFGSLNSEQLNWKPDEGVWSVGQNFDHLIKTNSLYLENLSKVADGTYKPNFWSKVPFLPGFIGGQILKASDPSSIKKIKTLNKFKPSESNLSAALLGEFLLNQSELIGVFEKLNDTDLESIIVTPASNAINISVRDAIEVLVLHERRHINQAKEVMKTDGFPA